MKHAFLFSAIAVVAAFAIPDKAFAATDDGTATPSDDGASVAASFDDEAGAATTRDDAAPPPGVVSPEIVSDAELGDQRGGFALAGMDIRLGAEMRTYLNGDLALLTVVNWDAAGATVRQTASGALTPARLDALQAGLASSGSFALKVGDTPVFTANGGQTAILQRFDNAIQNVLINTASNISVTQQTDATIDLSGYQGFQSDIISSRMSDALGSSIGAATLGAIGR
jgi:hypothetical protein